MTLTSISATRRRPGRFGAAPTAFLFSLALLCSSAEAGGLKDTIKDLYGGDGITLGQPTMFDHTPHFTATSFEGLDRLSEAIAPNLNNIAFNSTVTAFTFDLERGVPVRSTDSLGPLLAERATTVGARKLNVVFTYTRLDYSKFDGTNLNNLSLDFIHDDTCPPGAPDGELGPAPFPFGFCDFELDLVGVDIDLDIEQDVFALIATYGLTRNWDVGIVVPIVHTSIDAVADGRVIDKSATTDEHAFDVFPGATAPGSDPRRSTGGGDETGLGDVIIRTKYNFLRKHSLWPDLAIRGDIKFRTGDEDDLLGTGDDRFQGLLIASKTFGPVTPHLNFGGQVSDEDSDQNNVRYITGFDVSPHQRVTLALDVLGQWRPDGGIGDHLVDLAPQLKWNVFRTFVLDTFFLIPMNKNEGLRTDFTWTVGVEYLF